MASHTVFADHAAGWATGAAAIVPDALERLVRTEKIQPRTARLYMERLRVISPLIPPQTAPADWLRVQAVEKAMAERPAWEARQVRAAVRAIVMAVDGDVRSIRRSPRRRGGASAVDVDAAAWGARLDAVDLEARYILASTQSQCAAGSADPASVLRAVAVSLAWESGCTAADLLRLSWCDLHLNDASWHLPATRRQVRARPLAPERSVSLAPSSIRWLRRWRDLLSGLPSGPVDEGSRVLRWPHTGLGLTAQGVRALVRGAGDPTTGTRHAESVVPAARHAGRSSRALDSERIEINLSSLRHAMMRALAIAAGGSWVAYRRSLPAQMGCSPRTDGALAWRLATGLPVPSPAALRHHITATAARGSSTPNAARTPRTAPRAT